MVNDGSSSTAIVLFDKVAEYLIKHITESLSRVRVTEVEGMKRVASILQQFICTTEIFHAKLDKFMARSRQRKLIATKIPTRADEGGSKSTDASTAKVQLKLLSNYHVKAYQFTSFFSIYNAQVFIPVQTYIGFYLRHKFNK